MNIIEIKKNNAADYSEVLGPDLTDDMERCFYYAHAAVDDDGKVCGVLVYELTNADNEDDTESNIVLFHCDNDEVRSMLWSEYEKSVKNNDIVITHYETGDEALAGFYESVGFSKSTVESRQISLTVGDLSSLPVNLSAKLPSNILNNQDISVIQYRNAVKNFLVKGAKGSVTDLAYLKIGWFERDISACAVSDDKVDGMFLIRKTPSGELHPVLYAAFGPEFMKNLGAMLVFTAKKAIEQYPPDTVIRIKRHNKQVAALCTKMLSGRKGEPAFSGEITHS